jgi:hypothetical protein
MACALALFWFAGNTLPSAGGPGTEQSAAQQTHGRLCGRFVAREANAAMQLHGEGGKVWWHTLHMKAARLLQRTGGGVASSSYERASPCLEAFGPAAMLYYGRHIQWCVYFNRLSIMIAGARRSECIEKQ